MARKRRIRQRDSEATKRKLLDAIGAIMREQGYTGLKTNIIAKWIGKDKNLIRYHFQGLANLEMAYIKEKDYWPPFFKKFALGPDADAVDIEILFVELMKENLRFFYDNDEMQKIILWQISEANTVLKSISEAREIDGAKLLDRTDIFFRNTDINFRTVIALMLGGVYYIVLHGKTNNSVVCGININIQEDRDDLLRSIQQIISWSWKQVTPRVLIDTKIKQEVYEYELLENFASRIRKNFLQGQCDLLMHNDLNNELKRIERVLLEKLNNSTSDGQIQVFLKLNLFRLFQIADRFYNPGDLVNEEARVIAALTLRVIEPVIEMVPGQLQLPIMLWEILSLNFVDDIPLLEDKVITSGADQILVQMIMLPFYRFLNSRLTMKWHDYTYLQQYKIYLDQMLLKQGISCEDLQRSLITSNLNDENAIEYLKRKIKKKTVDQDPEHLAGMLLDIKKRISQLTINMKIGFVRDQQGVANELASWLNAELEYLKEEPIFMANHLKIKTNMNATQLAVWQKIQHDHGVYDEPNLNTLTEKIANNFSTKGQPTLSPASIKSKLFAKDSPVIDSIEQLLRNMLGGLRKK